MNTAELSSLLKDASTAAPAKPVLRASRGRWATLWPVFKQLRDNRFTGEAAVEWLIGKGVLKDTEKDQAHRAFRGLAARRKKQEAQ